MSRVFKFSLIIMLALLTLCACSFNLPSGELPTDIAVDIALLYPEEPERLPLFFDGAGDTDAGYISREKLLKLYCSESDGRESAISALELCDGWAIILSPGTELFELHVFRARNTADADVIAKLLYRRVKLLRSYDFADSLEDGGIKPGITGSQKLFGGYEYDFSAMYGESAYVAANSMVYTRGRYVFLLATPDNDSAVKRISRICGR